MDKEAILPVVRSACDADHSGIWVDDRCTDVPERP